MFVPARRFWFESATCVVASLRSIAFENVVSAMPMTASVIIDATMSSTIVKPLSEWEVRMSASAYANREM